MRVLLFPTALALSLVVGCSMGSADSSGAPPSGSGGNGAGGTMMLPGGGSQPMTLKFATDSPVALGAREQTTFRVQASPPGVYRMSFGLPSDTGEPLDAVLDLGEADTDAQGNARVQLTAPSSPTKFQLRASVGGVAVTWDLTVADGGVATVQVEPRRLNLSALRDITTWNASAYAEKTCADLKGFPPDDGPYPAPVAAKQDAPIIPQVPASTRLAIVLRSGHFIGGCTTVESLPPGPITSPQVVVVSLLNKPIDLGNSRLTLALSVGESGAAWQSQLTEAGVNVQTALLGTGTDDVDSLLDAMREASGDSRQAFENARKAETWDDLLGARWGSGAATYLRDLAGSWLTAGRQRFMASTPTFSGLLSPITEGSAQDPAAAKLELSAVAGLDAARAGFTESAQVAWSASADDTLALGTDLYFVRSQLATALAEAHAIETFADAADAPAALAAAVDCETFGGALAAAGADDQLAYGTCGATCLTALCESALVSLWNRARDAEGLEPARLSLTATGKAYVGDGAEVAGMNGSWIGELGSGSQKVATGGIITGSAPPGTR
jgi:hypothetical protein